jgi:hypothetical protein
MEECGSGLREVAGFGISGIELVTAIRKEVSQ